MASSTSIEVGSTPIDVPSGVAFPLYEYQKLAVDREARFTWTCWSRQIGKSTIKSLRRIIRGLQRRRTQIFLSSSERQSRELMLKARTHCKAMKMATEFIDNKTFEGTSFKQLEIVMPNGIRIIGLPANPDTAVGYTGDVLLDEFSKHRDSLEIWGAVFPTVTRGEGELDVCGTPKGRKNQFYLLRSNKTFDHQTLTIHDAIRLGYPADAEKLRAGLGNDEKWRQEYLCEFLDEATAYLTYEQIVACQDVQLRTAVDLDDLREYEGDVYVGVDIGRKHDLTVIWPFKMERGRLISAGLIELRNVPFQKQYERLCEILDLKCVRRCCIDSTGLGMQMAEQAVYDFGSHRVEAVWFTGPVKAELAGDLRIKVEDRSIAIPDSDRIREDWHAIEKHVTIAGNIRFQADRSVDGHADRFWAAALAVHAGGNPSGPAEAFSAGRSVFATKGAW